MTSTYDLAEEDQSVEEERARMTNRRHLLVDAANTIDGDRNASYGEPIDDFGRTAILLQTYLDGIVQSRGRLVIVPHDIAAIQVLVKLSRLVESPQKRDHWLDIAGYAGCGWDTIVASQREEQGS